MPITSCDTCHLNYVGDDPDDRRLHIKLHNRWLAATAALGNAFLPISAREIEHRKADAYDQLAHGATLRERVEGAETAARMWFHRSMNTAIECNYWREHPTAEEFIAMLDIERTWNDRHPDVVRELRAKFGPWKPGIDSGRSRWFPPRKPE